MFPCPHKPRDAFSQRGIELKKKIAGSVLMLALSTLASAAPTQWTVGSGGNGHWYEYVGNNVTWSQAASAATTMGGYLATVTSASENMFVSSNIANGAWAWLGASDAAVEGTFVWQGGPEAGQAITYTNWNFGEPNNLGNEDYLHTNSCGTGCWNDWTGHNMNGYVVEYTTYGVAPVPEPETYAMMLAGLGLLGVMARRRKQKSVA
jgi:hypothetical protein